MRTFLLFLTLLALAGSAQAQQRAATITNIAPTFGPPGTTVIIRGAGFNGFEPVTIWVKELANEPPPGVVEFNGVPGDILFWQDDLITVKVPKGASTGAVRVILPRARILATDMFDVYYSTPDDKPRSTREVTEPSQSADDARRGAEREPRLRFDNGEPPLVPFYANPWFSNLSPGERTFLGEQGFGNTFLFGNPFSLGRQRSLFTGRDGFRNDRFGFQNPFFGNFLFRGSRFPHISPFWFRFR
ncbi:MAG TPA: IPT/TIG domain-containing protein [Blastocatellia bacterium]|nr:IPT/TIG domain-containing protein [Blastocatellia bacterium]